jgi:hypothetical protein
MNISTWETVPGLGLVAAASGSTICSELYVLELAKWWGKKYAFPFKTNNQI